MSRYIEVNELINNINKSCNISRYAKEEILQILDETTSADVEPVKQGKWICRNLHGGKGGNCGQCGRYVDKTSFYCPTCGAKMDGEK